jgi:hypothetical protein
VELSGYLNLYALVTYPVRIFVFVENGLNDKAIHLYALKVIWPLVDIIIWIRIGIEATEGIWQQSSAVAIVGIDAQIIHAALQCGNQDNSTYSALRKDMTFLRISVSHHIVNSRFRSPLSTRSSSTCSQDRAPSHALC